MCSGVWNTTQFIMKGFLIHLSPPMLQQKSLSHSPSLAFWLHASCWNVQPWLAKKLLPHYGISCGSTVLRLRRFGIKISQASNSVPNLLVPNKKGCNSSEYHRSKSFTVYQIPPWESSFEDDFPFPKLGHFSSQESLISHMSSPVTSPWSAKWVWRCRTRIATWWEKSQMRCKLERLWDFLYDSQKECVTAHGSSPVVV